MALPAPGEISPATPTPASALTSAFAFAFAPNTGAILRMVVPGCERTSFLPRVFGRRFMMAGEAAVFGWMSRLCPEYSGGFWDFIDLSNGGFYLRLASDERFAVVVDGNGFSDTLSADAASVVATLFAINELLFAGAGPLHDAYYALRDYAGEHAEGSHILSAID